MSRPNWTPAIAASTHGRSVVALLHERNAAESGPLTRIAIALNLHPYKDGYRGSCPAHLSESGESFTIRLGRDGELRLCCFGGCAYGDIYDALAARGLVTPRKNSFL